MASQSTNSHSIKQGPRPLQLATTLTSASSSSPSSPSPLSRSNSTNSITPRRPNPKRLSSISYSNSSVASLLFSPTSPALLSAPLGRQERNSVEKLPSDAAQTEDAKPPPVVTLAEKHSDLLQFIAQKESKCLELRSQLEQHEAELRILKSKWERIVSKAKPKSANGGSTAMNGMSGEVVGVIRDFGKYFGGFGNDENKASFTRRNDLTSSTPSPLSSPARFETELGFDSRSSSAQDISGLGHLRRKDLDSQRLSTSSTSSSRTKADASAWDSISSISTATSSPEFMSPSDDITPIAGDNEVEGASVAVVSRRSSTSVDLTGWVPAGLNKKWEKVQKTEIFSKHTHRASLLLSDVSGISNNFLESLSSAILPPPPDKPSLTKRSNTISSPGLTLSASKGQNTSHRVSTISLLDEEEGENTMSTLDKPIVPRLSPQIKATPPVPSPTSARSKKKPEEVEEEWNW